MDMRFNCFSQPKKLNNLARETLFFVPTFLIVCTLIIIYFCVQLIFSSFEQRIATFFLLNSKLLRSIYTILNVLNELLEIGGSKISGKVVQNGTKVQRK